ncbi:MAG: heme-binding domain-containing protein [Anaerolineae bacterium]|nr:heme-binding domain-containing protein [Anaerolineae bacterium]
MTRRKLILILVGLAVGGFILIQFIPLGAISDSFKRDENPPVEFQIQWDSPETEQLVRTACYDCHSNETVWPWYSYVAPASWLIVRDVNFGRARMNFSRTDIIDYTLEQFFDDIDWHLENGMPPRKYLILHPNAALNTEQQEQLLSGIRTTFTALVASGQLSEHNAPDGQAPMNMDNQNSNDNNGG